MNEFYQPSLITIKYRSGFFISSGAFITMLLSDHRALKILDVSVPDKLINYLLPLIIIWFFILYFSSMLSEFIVWKQVIHDFDRISNRKYNPKNSFIPHLDKTGSTLVLRYRESVGCGVHINEYSSIINEDDRELLIRLKKLMDNCQDEFNLTVSEDLAIISEYNMRMQRFGLFVRLKHYIFDRVAPVLVLIFNILVFFWTDFIIQVMGL
ncbi:hypothetical protein F2Z80_20910 [Vibrio fortis]|uniref:Uncharacterized protein n=1 Tax=Vibrio fortis TaxID=212667 RepID=A0A5N3S5F3_9VIBR|nr:hypothetical protein [Vibrio fortis]KAB0301522.1 hypothetical protein F2Z80_20910 [Vibrio fortis]